MAKTYRCDRCGHEEVYTNGIVGNEFDYHAGKHRRRFHTLAPAFRNKAVVDVCNACFCELAKVKDEAEARHRGAIDTIPAAVRAAI